MVEAACENRYQKLWVQSAYLQKNEDVTQAPAEGYNTNHETNARSALASPSSLFNISEKASGVNGENVATFAEVSQKYGKQAKEAGIKLTPEQAYEEVICDACQKMLMDTDAGMKLAEFGAQSEQNRNFLAEFKKWLTESLEKLRDLFRNVEPDSLPAKGFQKFDTNVKRILANMFVDMSVDAGEKLSTIKEAGMLEKITTNEGGVKYCFGITQADIDTYIDAAYENNNFEDVVKYAETSDRLIDAVSSEIDISGYSHALRDNDIRHIRNSHGENTNEKYPVTKSDLARIPYIVENYDKVFVKTNSRGKPGIVYVKVGENNVVYYVEAVTTEYHNEKLLVNKQMVKTGIDEIPNLYGLIAAINKKESSSQYLADLQEIRKAYAQGVKENYSDNSIRNASEIVKEKATVQDPAQTMYSGKNKGNLATAAGDQAPANTPEAHDGTVPNNNIRNFSGNVKENPATNSDSNALNAEQNESTPDNIGALDGNNPDIRYKLPAKDAKNFKNGQNAKGEFVANVLIDLADSNSEWWTGRYNRGILGMSKTDDTEFRQFYQEIYKRTKDMDVYEHSDQPTVSDTFTVQDGNGKEYIYRVELDGYIHGVVLEKINKAKYDAYVRKYERSGSNGRSPADTLRRVSRTRIDLGRESSRNSGSITPDGTTGSGRVVGKSSGVYQARNDNRGESPDQALPIGNEINDLGSKAKLLSDGDISDDVRYKIPVASEANNKTTKANHNSYSYDNLIKKPDMKIVAIDGSVPQNRADIVYQAKKNAAEVGKFDPKTGSVSVHVDDIDGDVVLGTVGLKHGLDRRKAVNSLVVLKAGEILQSSIRINELTPKKAEANASYVLIGMAKNNNGELFVVRSLVNRFSNELTTMDVLYAMNAKKGNRLSSMLPGFQGPVTSSTISIANLLDYVNEYFPDILPEDVLKHYGYGSRPDGVLGRDALYKIPVAEDTSPRTLLANALESVAQNDIEKQKIAEYKAKVETIEAEEQKLHKLNAEIKELSFAKGPRDTAKIKALRDEATKIANRIGIYDKQLLRLEASKVKVSKEQKLVGDT